MAHTPGPWFVSGVRLKMDRQEWHGVNRYDEALKRDENIACVGYVAKTGLGLADARLIAAAPELLEAARMLAGLENQGRSFPTEEQCAFARAVISKAEGK